MPPVPQAQLPGELIERFTGPAHETLMRLLVWLCPVSVRSELTDPAEIVEGR